MHPSNLDNSVVIFGCSMMITLTPVNLVHEILNKLFEISSGFTIVNIKRSAYWLAHLENVNQNARFKTHSGLCQWYSMTERN